MYRKLLKMLGLRKDSFQTRAGAVLDDANLLRLRLDAFNTLTPDQQKAVQSAFIDKEHIHKPDFTPIKASLKAFILKRVAEYPANQPVKFIQFGYEYSQGGLFCLFFDTRSDAGPDGTWTVRLDGNSIDMPDWPHYADDVGSEFGIVLGETIKSLAVELRDRGAFAALPKQNGCEFGVEEMNGSYGWPKWEDRRKENLA